MSNQPSLTAVVCSVAMEKLAKTPTKRRREKCDAPWHTQARCPIDAAVSGCAMRRQS